MKQYGIVLDSGYVILQTVGRLSFAATLADYQRQYAEQDPDAMVKLRRAIGVVSITLKPRPAPAPKKRKAKK